MEKEEWRERKEQSARTVVYIQCSWPRASSACRYDFAQHKQLTAACSYWNVLLWNTGVPQRQRSSVQTGLKTCTEQFVMLQERQAVQSCDVVVTMAIDILRMRDVGMGVLPVKWRNDIATVPMTLQR